MLIGLLLFSDFSKSPTVVSEKIDPYVLSTKWSTIVLRDKVLKTVEEGLQMEVQVGDKIRTLDSTATVYWPDGSVTRLWKKSSIIIHEMRAKTASEQIQVDFTLESGKSWSNVVRYMFGDSYFHERFSHDSLAAIRGTVFEINLEKGYIHTIDHGVSIEPIESGINSTGGIFVPAGWIVSTDAQKTLGKERLDEAWNIANTTADIVYLKNRSEATRKEMALNLVWKNVMSELKTSVQEANVDAYENVSMKVFERIMRDGEGEKKQTNLMNLYQKLYGLENTSDILEVKILLRDAIIDGSDGEKQKNFLDDFARSILYDIWDVSPNDTHIQGLHKKLEEYIQRWASKEMIDQMKEWKK